MTKLCFNIERENHDSTRLQPVSKSKSKSKLLICKGTSPSPQMCGACASAVYILRKYANVHTEQNNEI